MSAGKARLQGTTLFELMVCSALMGILLLALATLVFYGNGYLRRAEGGVEIQGELLRALSKLAREVTETNPETVSVAPGAVSFASPRDEDGLVANDSFGRLQWGRYVGFYLSMRGETPVLVRRDKPMPSVLSEPPTDNTGFEPTDIMAYSASPEQVVARNVVEMECYRPELSADWSTLSPEDQGKLRRHLRTRLVCRLSYFRKVYLLRLSTSTFMRN